MFSELSFVLKYIVLLFQIYRDFLLKFIVSFSVFFGSEYLLYVFLVYFLQYI